MSSGPEFELVEQPLIGQLVSMGWKYTTGNLDHPSVTARERFRQVLLLDDLRKALVRLNLNDDGDEWLDDARVSQAVSALKLPGTRKLMEANQACTELLLKGTAVQGVEGWVGGKTQTVHYIDWEHPERNNFLVINQFRVDEPGGQVKRFVVPDLVLFVNGIPLVVIECKSPYLSAPMEEAIDQIQRYANQRAWVEGNEGSEKLFHTNQFVVGTHYDQARVGSISATAVHFLEWKDTCPLPEATVAESLDKDRLSSQETLVAGMLNPRTFLDIVRHFCLFSSVDGKTIKIVPRYQQYRATHVAVERLLTGKTRLEDGEHDRRGGIIWHTQGSGKSLTMIYLVRKLRTDPNLRKFKIVLVTDRKNLQQQLSETADLAGEPVRIAKNTETLKEILAEKGPGLVFAMIQKFQETEPPTTSPLANVAEGAVPYSEEAGIEDTKDAVGEFPVVNDDESILVLVDEAHRSHTSALHANLLKSLPNCARIGFTGTPIIMGAKKSTHEIFGDYIDRYTIKQSEEDGATIPIIYEGRTVKGAVTHGTELDELFVQFLPGYTADELELIKAKYATTGHVMETPELIQEKARDILRHYVENILPNGFKAQLVAVSRLAALRYLDALNKAQVELVDLVYAELDPELWSIGDDAMDELNLDRRTQYLIRASRHIDTIGELEFAPVISGDHNDPPAWAEWTNHAKGKARIERFKKPLFHDDPAKQDPLALLIVKSMLITGFDAPIEQAMYLDRPIREAELLQAIARVNRTYQGKSAGMIVDYYGVAHHLRDALEAYSDEDVEGALHSLEDEIPKLRDRHSRTVNVFQVRGLELEDEERCVELLRDEKVRAEFLVKLKRFLTTLDFVLPRPEALPFVNDARILGHIQLRARNLYRDDMRPIGKEVGEKVRRLIDDHVLSLGIDPKIPPISILDSEFNEHVEKQKSSRAKAAEMEHAARHHIRKHFGEDPEFYGKLSERLEQILTELKDHWDELAKSLYEFVGDVQAGRSEDTTGLDPDTQGPFLGVLKQALVGDGEPSDEQLARLCSVTIDLADHVQQEIRVVGFWENAYAQDVLRGWIFQYLDDEDLVPFEKLPALADSLVELAKVNHHRLVK